MKVDYDKDGIKKISSIDDTMLRFISKEGCNQFPTVVLLANRMYLSDEINMIKDLNIDTKIKVGDNYHWYKSNDFRSNLRKCVSDIISGVTFFEEDKTSNLTNVIKVFKPSSSEFYFVTGTDILFGSYESQVKITCAESIDTNKLLVIFRQGSDDFAIVEKNVYYIDRATHTMTKKYSASSKINDVSANEEYVVLATTSGGEVLTRGSGGSLSKSYSVEHESWTVSTGTGTGTGTGAEGSDSGSSSGTTGGGGFITVTNGFPLSNNAELCCIMGNYFYIGDTETMSKFNLGNIGDNR